MSTMIMSQCWPLQMPPTPKAVLISLADNANDHGVCWPSLQTIALRTCFSERAVQNAVKWLEQHGALRADRSNGRHTSYIVSPASYIEPVQVPVPAAEMLSTTPAGDAPPQEMHPRSKCGGTPAGDAPTPAGGAGVPPQEIRIPPQEVPSNRKEPSLEPSRNRQGQASLNAFALPQWISAEAWAGYLEMRRKIGKPPTDRARDLVIAELVKLREKGQDANAVLDQSTRSSWTDVYPLKAPGGRALLDWHATDAGVLAKGEELGIKPNPGEYPGAFKQRVFAAVDKVGQPATPRLRPVVEVRETVAQIESDGKREMPQDERRKMFETVGLGRKVKT